MPWDKSGELHKAISLGFFSFLSVDSFVYSPDLFQTVALGQKGILGLFYFCTENSSFSKGKKRKRPEEKARTSFRISHPPSLHFSPPPAPPINTNGFLCFRRLWLFSSRLLFKQSHALVATIDKMKQLIGSEALSYLSPKSPFATKIDFLDAPTENGNLQNLQGPCLVPFFIPTASPRFTVSCFPGPTLTLSRAGPESSHSHTKCPPRPPPPARHRCPVLF